MSIQRYLPLLGRVLSNEEEGRTCTILFRSPPDTTDLTIRRQESDLTCGTAVHNFFTKGTAVFNIDSAPKPSLLELPNRLLGHIFAVTIATNKTIVIDFAKHHDRKTYLDAGLGLVGINARDFRGMVSSSNSITWNENVFPELLTVVEVIR
jgi:hypothetical protein